MAHTSEYEIEDIFIDRLEGIGYKFIKLNNYDEVLANFREQLAKFNAKKLEEKGHTASFSDSEFNRIMIHVDNHSVYESAKVLRDKYDLQLDNGESVYIEFFSGDTDRNIYQVTHQVTMDKAHKDDVVYKNRYDVTVLINGLPLVQIELKRPGVEINEAINQINRYRKFSFKGIFRYLQLFVVSNSVQTKYFCNENEMLDGQYNPILKSLVFFWTDEKNTRINDLNTFTGEFFRKSAITEMLNKYMVIKTTEPVLMVMRPYQIYAVKAAKKRVLEVNQNGYVFACTGSGKTLTSFKLAQILRDEPMVDLVVFLIDRKDLDDQTIDEYNSFEKDCVDRTNSTAVLINMLKSSEKKMIVTTIQKMANAVKNPKYAAVMDAYKDKKVVFIIDECHRSQFGKMHSLIQKHFERANYIGFTGTPIFERNKGVDGRTTADVFYAGDKLDACLHKYMIKDAIADGNVLRFSVEYQSVVSAEEISINGIDPKQLDDPEYCRRHNIDIESLYHNDERISKIAKHIFEHHEQHAHPQGKDIYHMDETDGRVAVLLPHGVLFRGGAEEAIRKYIIKDLNRLDAVIGLPANLFHGTGIPVCVLVLKSNRNGNSGNILFIDASKEFKPGKNQNILEQEHIDKIVDAYEKRAEIDKFAHKAYMSEIIENGYNLNIPRYVDTFEEEEPVDLDAVRNRIKTLDSETKAAIDKAESFMRELGL